MLAKEFYDSTIQKQIFLAEHGVPFEYTDTLSNVELEAFLDTTIDWIDKKNKANQNTIV